MKRFLAAIIAIMLVAMATLSFTAFADETETAADETIVEESADAVETEEEASDSDMPDASGYDESTISQYIVLDFLDDEIKYTPYISGSDGSLEYLQQLYKEYYGMECEIVDYEGVKAISMGENIVEISNLVGMGIGYIEEEGLFGTATTYIYIDQSGANSYYEEGKKLLTVIFNMDSKPYDCKNAMVKKDTVSRDVIAGENNTFSFSVYKINLINILIAVMIVIVIILAVIIFMIYRKKKKALLADNAEVFDGEIPAEALEVIEKIESADEIVEEIIEEEPVEDVAQETTEE